MKKEQETHNQFKELLMHGIESEIDFKLRKATEYPNHQKMHNESAECLKELYDYISKLPDNHDLFVLEKKTIESESAMLDILTNRKIRISHHDINTAPEQWVEREIKEIQRVIDEM